MKVQLKTLMAITILLSTAKAQQLTAGFTAPATQIIQPTSLLVPCDTIFSFPAQVGWPSGLTSDGTYLWISDYNSPYLYKFSSTGVLLDTILIPNNSNVSTLGGDLDFDGNYILFGREDDGTLYKVDPLTKTIVSQFSLPQHSLGDPNDFGIAFDGTFIWHTSYSPNSTLYKLDATTGAIISTFSILPSLVLPLKFINGTLWGISLSGNIAYSFDTSNGNVLSSFPWCLNYPLGITKHNNHLWGLDSQVKNRIYEFDTLLTTSFSNIQPADLTFQVMNPLADILQLNFQKITETPVKIRITNLFGQCVFFQEIYKQQNTVDFLISYLKDGAYVLTVESGGSQIHQKIIKQSF